MEKHPITPPPELAAKWVHEIYGNPSVIPLHDLTLQVIKHAARWGADQELEACCSIALVDPVCGTKHQRSMLVRHIRERRRPKPPSLKEQALQALAEADLGSTEAEWSQRFDTIRRALEQLDD
jgi:hypothetical protein